MKLSTQDICQIALFVGVMAVFAQVSIPQPLGVPFSLQAWAVALAGLVLGPKKGAIAAFIYILLGTVGVPVFTMFSNGAGVVARNTVGFVVSFPFMAFVAGFGRSEKIWAAYLWLFIAIIINFTFGLLYFSWALNISMLAAAAATVTPFILPTAVKLAILPWIALSIRRALKRAGVVYSRST